MSVKKSWDYQKGRYKQLNIKFDMENDEDILLWHFLSTRSNATRLIKMLIRNELWDCAYNEE